MAEELKNVGEEYQRLSKEGFDAAARSFGEMNKGFQALAAEMTDYSKRTFEDVFRAWEQLLGARSMDRAFEIQSQYAKKAYDNYVAEVSKLGEMCVSLARDAYKPVEQAAAARSPRAAS
jgi:phasin family protein